MQWLNEPVSWQRTGNVLRVSVDPGTDFWRQTGYGYVHDNGHVYGALLPGDLDVSVRVRGFFASQYDQAGIMLRADEDIWLKTGLEFFEGRLRLSTVVTVGWSSWMVADLPPGTDEVTLRVSRRGDAVEVRYLAADGTAELAALVFMPPGREMLAGIMCAAPEGAGFSVAFHDLRIVGREWNGQDAADGVGWAGDKAGWAEGKADDAGAAWAQDEADKSTPARAGKAPSALPAGLGGQWLAGKSLDWAQPPASDAAEDWDRLSLSVSSTWDAFEAGKPASKQPQEPSAVRPDEPAAEQPGKAAVELPGKAAVELPDEPTAQQSGKLAAEQVDKPAADQGDKPAANQGDRKGGDGKPASSAPVLPAPADPADEWISLLAADSADELSGPGPAPAREGSGPGVIPAVRSPGEWPHPGRLPTLCRVRG